MAGLEDLSPQDQQAHRLGKLLLEKNPEIARRAKRLAKEADPALRIPEIELEDQIAAATKDSQKRIDELEQRQIATDVERRRERFRAECTEQGLDPEAVEKIVVDEKCSTATAIKLALAQRQTAEPTAGDVFANPPGTPIDMRPEKDVRKLAGGALRRWSADTAHAMVDQFRKTRRA
jgi:hypothetical protein